MTNFVTVTEHDRLMARQIVESDEIRDFIMALVWAALRNDEDAGVKAFDQFTKELALSLAAIREGIERGCRGLN